MDIQRAAQVIAQAEGDLDGVLNVVFAANEEILSGYIAYEGRPVVPFRVTAEDWPSDEKIPEDEEIPDNTVGVFEPERPQKSFWPLEEFIKAFDPSDYGDRPKENGFLPLRLV
jgi:hypothetical protein